MKTGPNDARRVVWAIGKFFFFFLSSFNILTNDYIVFSSNLHFEGFRWAVIMKMGSNNAICIIWALGMSL